MGGGSPSLRATQTGEWGEEIGEIPGSRQTIVQSGLQSSLLDAPLRLPEFQPFTPMIWGAQCRSSLESNN